MVAAAVAATRLSSAGQGLDLFCRREVGRPAIRIAIGGRSAWAGMGTTIEARSYRRPGRRSGQKVGQLGGRLLYRALLSWQAMGELERG